MQDNTLLVLSGNDVTSLLTTREPELIDLVARAYVVPRNGASSLPYSIFLRFSGDESNRIIALPAFLGDGFDGAGMKWIASFPANVGCGMERASAVLILHSCETDRPEVILEGSALSARCIAASTALAARVLLEGAVPEGIGLIGTGVINLEIARFLLAAFPGARRSLLFDPGPERAHHFARAYTSHWARRSGIDQDRAVGRNEGMWVPRRAARASSATRWPTTMSTTPKPKGLTTATAPSRCGVSAGRLLRKMQRGLCAADVVRVVNDVAAGEDRLRREVAQRQVQDDRSRPADRGIAGEWW